MLVLMSAWGGTLFVCTERMGTLVWSKSSGSCSWSVIMILVVERPMNFVT